MTEEPLFKAWEVLTCQNGHPQWIVVKPIPKGFRHIYDEIIPIGKRKNSSRIDSEWHCYCGAKSYAGSTGGWILYVKGKPRQ